MAKNKSKLILTGHEEILADIEALGRNMPEVVKEALEAQGKSTNKQYKAFIDTHMFTGITESAIVENPKVENDGTKIKMKTGFNIDEGGIAAIFLDKGTPTIKPENFIRKIKKTPASIKVFEGVLEKNAK